MVGYFVIVVVVLTYVSNTIACNKSDSRGFFFNIVVIKRLQNNNGYTVYWPSKSAWSGLYTNMQLSCRLLMLSPSISGSHSSPFPSPSVSSWLELAIFGQLSTLSWIPSLLYFRFKRYYLHYFNDKKFEKLFYLSLSISLSQASPIRSLSESVCVGLCMVGQLSQTSPRPSLSVSLWSGFAFFGQLSSWFNTPAVSSPGKI